ncbi:MAG: cell wall hydrolase [Sphingomonas bacterium]|nr:cell wall hydrolase [Sphingomonas bacterium]
MLLLLVGLIGAQFHRAGHDQMSAERSVAVPLPEALAQPNSFKPLTVEQAIEANGNVPFAQRRDDAAREFMLKIDGDDRGRAVECLSQAVYYEAASEGAEGQRAVAQVVLNRLRHPGYPSSICGVVYQGSQRVMGCQFTFTCDGSLLRRPNLMMFAAARRIAIEALAGRVFAPVGHATNYHADYVLPYWAASLDKLVQVGRHIFYRLKGNLGSSSAFSQRYAGREPDIVPQSTIIVTGQAVAESSEVLVPVVPGSVTIDRSPNPIIVADAVIQEPLAADTRSGALMIGEGTPSASNKKVTPTKDCPPKDSTRILPTAPNELRSNARVGC